MSSRYDYTYTLGTNKEEFLSELAKTMETADRKFSKSNLTLKLVCDEKGLQKQLEKLKTLNPDILTTVTLDISKDGLKQDVDLMTQVINKKIEKSKIGTTLKDQIKKGIADDDIKATVQDLLDDTLGSGTKITANNVKELVATIKRELKSLDFSFPDAEKSIEAYDKIVALAEKYNKLSNIFSSPKRIQDAGLTKEVNSFNAGFDFNEFKNIGDEFFNNASKYISDNANTLKDSLTKRYQDAAFSIYNNLKAIVTSMGNPLVAAFTVDNAKSKSNQLSKQIEELVSQKNALIEESQKAVQEITGKAATGKDPSSAEVNKMLSNYEVFKQIVGDESKLFSTLSKAQADYLTDTINTTNSMAAFEEKARAVTQPLEWELKSLQVEKDAATKFISEMNEEIQKQVQSEKAKNTVDVEINPVITDPAEFAAKIEAQLANQIVKIAVEPVINSVAEFQELLRQQLPNEFIDVKFNLENGSTLSLDKILGQFDILKETIEKVKGELSNLETLSESSLTSIKSIFDQFTIQQPTSSTQFSEILKSIEQLQANVGKDIDMDKVANLVQSLNQIGELKVSPTVDLSNFNLDGINQYLDKTDNLKALGETLNLLADGLDSLNIALTGANFSELKDFVISNEVLENLPKFADGLENLGKKLQSFSTSATGVLSSITQIVSQSKNLEYLYKLSTSPSTGKQSNIVGNGLMNAFDKSAINTIQRPAGSTDEIAALAKEYQWLASQAKNYFTLASKYAKGTISSEDSLKLTQLERALTGATQRMSQFQETDQSLVTAQNDLQSALNQCGTAVENGLVSNLTKALDKIDTAESKALGFANSIQEVKNKATEIQKVFATGGLISSSEVEKAEDTLRKALDDIKQLRQEITTAQKAQENEIKNSYKNIFNSYDNTMLHSSNRTAVSDEVGIRKLVNEYNYLNGAISEYIQLLGKEAANPDKSAERTAKINALTQAYTDFLARATAGVDTENRLAKASGDLSNALSNVGQNLSSDLSKKTEKYIKNLKDAKDGTTKYSDTIKTLQETQQKLSALSETKITDISQIKGMFDMYQVGANAYSEAAAKINAAQKEVLESAKAQLSLDIENWLARNTKAASKYGDALRQLQNDLNNVSTMSELDELKTKVLNFEESAEKAKLTGSAFADTLKQKFKELGTYLMSFASFYRVVNVLKQGVSIVHEYDDAFTEMRKVTDASTSSLNEFQKESFKLADQVGTTAQNLQQSTADWLRLGESFEEAKKSAQDTTVLLNISEFEDIDSATDSLVAMSQAFKDLDKMEIIDKLNNVGNNFSISTNELAESLQRSVATLKVAGDDLDEAIALTVAGRLTA